MAYLKRYPWLYGLGLLTAACSSQSGPSEAGQAGSTDVKVEENAGQSTMRVGTDIVRTTHAKVSNAALVKVDGTEKSQVLTWNEALSNGETTPYYAIHDGSVWHEAKTTSYQVPLRARRIDPLREVQSKELPSATSHLHVVQYISQPLEEYRRAIVAAGGQVHHYLHGNAQLVRANYAAIERISALPFVRAVTPMVAHDKVEETLDATRGLALGPVKLNVVLVDPKEDRPLLEDHIRALGGKIAMSATDSLLIEVELDRRQVDALTQLDQVLWVEPSTPIEYDFENARVQGGANYLAALPPTIPNIPNYTGVGIRGHIMEGINPNHPDFAANDHRVKPVGVQDTAADSHGHQTFGIVFGSGAGNPVARGILPNGQGYFTNYSPNIIDHPGARATLVKKLIADHKIVFQTASWGNARTRVYGAISAEMDSLIFQNDIPLTQSQSNAGNQDSRPQAWAKNIISVGAVYHQGTVDPKDDKWNGGGSTGPAADGSTKPDLCAYYDQTTTAAVNGGYASFGGTSGATPMVAGYVGLALELWTNGVFGNPIIPKGTNEDLASFRFKNRPHFSTTKALLIHSAAPYPFTGETSDLTRTHQGWGFPDVRNLYERRGNVLVVNETDVLKNLQTKSYTKTVPAGATDFRATLVYSDKEAAVPAKIHRVNNLDLKVTAPNGTIYWGNNGLRAGNTSTAGGTHNTLDTVENVWIPSPAAGTWTVEVIADEVVADNHLETPEVDVDYALVVSHRGGNAE
ncbi:S8 family serine peptidase [Pendulispora albinea]|uniref:S8 family serine peptidase n=1 Tax=Pendulispora albinea TaxID=2741071 RepID=A0ABZ2M629_9BACT